MTTFIYPNDEIQNVTAEFVINERPILIQIKGLSENQSVILEYFHGDTCDGCWQPFKWCGAQVAVCYPQSQLVLPALVGTYRLVMNEVDDDCNMVPFDMANWDEVDIQYNKLDKEFDMTSLNNGCGCGCGDTKETLTTVIETGNGFVYINEDGVQQPVTFPVIPDETVTNVNLTSTGFTYTNENGVEQPIPFPVIPDETVTSVTVTPTGFIYTDENGTQSPISFPVNTDTDVSEVDPVLNVDTGVLTVNITEGGQTVSGTVDLMPFLCRWRVNHQQSMVNLAPFTFAMDSTSINEQGLSELTNTFTIDPKDDGAEPYLEYAVGFQKTQDGVDMSGRINFTMEYSVDGGPWNDLQESGDYNLTGSIPIGTEVEPSVRRQKIGPLSAGSHNVTTRIRILQNSLSVGDEFTNFRHTNRVEWSAMRFV